MCLLVRDLPDVGVLGHELRGNVVVIRPLAALGVGARGLAALGIGARGLAALGVGAGHAPSELAKDPTVFPGDNPLQEQKVAQGESVMAPIPYAA